MAKEFQVVKVGRLGWSVHSEHDSREAAEFEATRCNIFTDAQFSVWKTEDYRRFSKATAS